MNKTGPGAYFEEARKDYTEQFYGQYTRGKFRLDSEYRRTWRDHTILSGARTNTLDTRGWYTALAYRVSNQLELGSYYSQFVGNWGGIRNAQNNHTWDNVLSARLDLNSHWNLKVEDTF